MATAAARRSHQLGTAMFTAVIVESIASRSTQDLDACQIHVAKFVCGHDTVGHDT